MKKKGMNSRLRYRSAKNLWKKMKLLVAFFFGGLLAVSANTYSQQTKLSMKFEELTVKEVFNQIEERTEFVFFYNEDYLDINRKVSIDVKNENVENILDDVFKGTKNTFKIYDRQIVILSSELKELHPILKSEPKTEQKKDISGTVKDKNGESIPGVSVSVKGTILGGITNAEGQFRLSVPMDANTLVFSFVGMKSQEVAINGKTSVNIVMEEATIGLDEVVAIGYGTVKKIDLTGAVANVSGSDIKSQGVSDLTSSLQGKMPGVEIESAGGAPGSGTRILIRGVGTLGNATPLYIVDGVPVASIDNLNQSDIQSIDILKDASSAAIYGSRAANGVVLVTTKFGTNGHPVVQMNANYGIQNIAHEVQVLNAEQWATVSNAAHDAAGFKELDIAQNPQTLGAGTNWQNAIYKTAPVQQYDLTISSGNQNNNYSISGGYMDQDGIVQLSGYKRYNFRAKSETTVGPFKFGETVIYTNENTKSIPGGWGGQGGNVCGAALAMIPVFKIYDPTAVGGFAGAYGPVVNVANPVAMLNLENIDRGASNLLMNAYAELTIIPGLKYKLNLGYTNNVGTNSDYTKRYNVGTLFVHPTNDLSQSSDRNSLLLIENTLNYTKTFGKSNLQAFVGYTFQKVDYTYLSASKTNLADGIVNLDAGAGVSSVSGNSHESTLVSALGRVIYSYDNRYLMTASFRRDGSSRFSSSNRYGNFPSIALGWNIANEKFFAPLTKILPILKLRASYGELGNQEIGDYQYSAAIVSNINYVIGTTQQKWFGAMQTSLVSPSIKWENTKTSDVGIDAGLINNKLSITADYYNKITSDVLLNVPIPGSVGSSSSPVVNAGKICNNGIEIGINYSDHIGKLNYSLFGLLSSTKNNVLELGTGTQQIFGGQPNMHGAYTTLTQAGSPISGFYLIKDLGIFNSQAEIDAYKNKNGQLIQPNASPGDIKFLDANGDGQINSKDAVYSGSPFPNYEFGFGFKASMYNFDINVFCQGTQGNKIYNGIRQNLESMSLDYNYSTATLNAWTPQNHSNIPRAVINDPNYNDQSSSRFLEDGSYLRMKTLQIGYTFNDLLSRTWKISSLRVYASADNLFTITKYSGANPDIGRSGSILDRGVDYDFASYPLARTISVGIQLSL
jgi:TonB-linked SusC/RagA family outer membrane protein